MRGRRPGILVPLRFIKSYDVWAFALSIIAEIFRKGSKTFNHSRRSGVKHSPNRFLIVCCEGSDYFSDGKELTFPILHSKVGNTREMLGVMSDKRHVVCQCGCAYEQVEIIDAHPYLLEVTLVSSRYFMLPHSVVVRKVPRFTKVIGYLMCRLISSPVAREACEGVFGSILCLVCFRCPLEVFAGAVCQESFECRDVARLRSWHFYFQVY